MHNKNMQLDPLITPMDKPEVQALELQLNECVSELKLAVSSLQKEVMGYCALTGNSSTLSQIGKCISADYDFDNLTAKLEARRKKLEKAKQESRMVFEGQTEIPTALISKIEQQLHDCRKQKSKSDKMLKLIGRHNQSALQYPLTSDTILDINEAGFFAGKFSKELKKARKLLLQIRAEFRTDFEGFLEGIAENTKKADAAARDLEMKKQWVEGYESALAQYNKAAERYRSFDVQRAFGERLVQAFSDKTYISAFAGVSGEQGKTVVIAALKHLLMRSILDRAFDGINQFMSQPVDLNNGRNFSAFVSRLKETIEQFTAVAAIKSTVEIGKSFSFEDMYRRYLKEIGDISGVSISEYRKQSVDFSEGVIVENISFGVSSHNAGSLDVTRGGLHKQACFAAALSKQNHPSGSLQLNAG